MEFKTKKALLEYLGKDPNDRKLVDRMMVRGEVKKIDGGYEYINVDKERVLELTVRIKELDKKIEELKKEKADLIEQMINNTSSGDDNDIIDKVYKYLTQTLHINVRKDDFKEWIENN